MYTLALYTRPCIKTRKNIVFDRFTYIVKFAKSQRIEEYLINYCELLNAYYSLINVLFCKKCLGTSWNKILIIKQKQEEEEK